MIVDVKRRLYIGFAAAIILIVVIGIIALNSFERQNSEADLVKGTYQVINQLVSIQKLLIDMETGHRGFTSSGDRKFLQPYNEGLLYITGYERRLQELIADNQKQKDNAILLEDQINELIN